MALEGMEGKQQKLPGKTGNIQRELVSIEQATIDCDAIGLEHRYLIIGYSSCWLGS
jgi:hypothetical protein